MATGGKSGRKVLITGGTSGLGLELARKLLAAGYEVWVTGRTLKYSDRGGEGFHFLKTDFADLRNVSCVLSEVLETGLRFDVVISNAGVLGPPSFIETRDGFEYTFQVNYLAHLLVSELVAYYADERTNILFISVTSPVYKLVNPVFRMPEKSKYRSFRTYSESKYYLLLVTSSVCSDYPEKKLSGFSFDPGIFNSGIYRTQAKWFHGLYRFASPILRDPGKVATRLMGILFNDKILDGAIYKNVNSYSLLTSNNRRAEEVFLSESKKSIRPYLPPSKL